MVDGDYRRLLRAPAGSFFVLGLAGAGKTTWARSRFPDAHVIDLRDEGVCQRLLADPAALTNDLRSQGSRQVVVSEVQLLKLTCSGAHSLRLSRSPRVKERAAGIFLASPAFRWFPTGLSSFR